MKKTITAASIAAVCACAGLGARSEAWTQGNAGPGGQTGGQSVSLTGCVEREGGTGAGPTAMYRLTGVERMAAGNGTIAGSANPGTPGTSGRAGAPGASSPGSGTSSAGTTGRGAASAGRPAAGAQSGASDSTPNAPSMPAHPGTEYRLVAASSVDLSAHVNHRVQVSGTVASAAAAGMTSSATPASGVMSSGSVGAGTTGSGAVGASTSGAAPAGAAGSASGASNASGAAATTGGYQSGNGTPVAGAGQSPTFMVSSVRMLAATCN